MKDAMEMQLVLNLLVTEMEELQALIPKAKPSKELQNKIRSKKHQVEKSKEAIIQLHKLVVEKLDLVTTIAKALDIGLSRETQKDLISKLIEITKNHV